MTGPTSQSAARVVSRLSIAPVKSLGLEHRDVIELGPDGVSEDRRFYLVDASGRLVDRLVVGPLVTVSAWTDPDASRLRLTFPDGRVVEDAVRLGDPIKTPIYGRTAVGHVVDGPWAEALEPIAGRSLRLVRTDRPGGKGSHQPVSIVGEGSLDRLGLNLGVGAVDARRFRMLIELSGTAPHEEDTWCGRRIGLGSATIRVSNPVPRCAITTQDPDTGVRDLGTLSAIAAYRGRRDGKHLDFGVLGEVEVPGTVRVGDEVRLVE